MGRHKLRFMLVGRRLRRQNRHMPNDKRSTDLLEGAYAVKTPEDSVRYYRAFADTYDAEFAAQLGYAYPGLIAAAFARHAGPGDHPVADIGCGTGLVAAALGLPTEAIDGFDISREMLDKAADKGLYRALHRVDLTRPLTLRDRYGALVSAGTFTHGHLGPDPLIELLTLARPGALFVIGVNAEHFAKERFGDTLDLLLREERITDVARETVAIYDKPDTPHGRDEAQILTFRAT